MIPYEEPDYMKSAFNCPYCNAFSHHTWDDVVVYNMGDTRKDITIGYTAFCKHCEEFSFWFNKKMIIPSSGNAPLPNNDLSEDIKKDFEEARSIVNSSPRGAAALLRLCIQKLCKDLGEKGEKINDDISNLVKKGLPIKIQKSLDIVRVIGNNAVHPGLIDIKDDQETANKLFHLINLIVDAMISQPKEIDKIYNNLPEKDKEAINKRNNK
jgi:hypothetical protein